MRILIQFPNKDPTIYEATDLTSESIFFESVYPQNSGGEDFKSLSKAEYIKALEDELNWLKKSNPYD
jgi:hypothetical protein